MKKISQEKIDAIQRDRSAGAETTELMEKYHVSKTIIYRYTTPPPFMDTETKINYRRFA